MPVMEDAFAEAPWLLPTFGVLFGLIWGSFLNVVIHRLPLRQSLVSPRSRCPSCGKEVAAYDNVPLLSYLVLLGRCRHCKAGISLRYPFVEASVGAASLAAVLRHGPSLAAVVELAFVAAMVALIFIDYDHKILPDSITIPGTVLGLFYAGLRSVLALSPRPVGDALLGAALGFGLLFLVAEVYFRLRKEEGMGFGDVKMMAMVGAFVGWKGVLLTLFLGSLSGTLVGLLVLALQGGNLKSKLPFGTFIGLGAIATVYVGGPLIAWYSGLF
jgi:leader peptidase (prepilin peptidase) / N-methyltransferase